MNADGFELYKDNNSEWRWRFWSSGRITASSGEGYKNKEDCESSLHTLQKTASFSPIRTQDDDMDRSKIYYD